MNYKALAEHVAKRCRKALRAEGPQMPSKDKGGFWVGAPTKSSYGNEYHFGIGERNGNVRYDRTGERWEWRGYVTVYQSGSVVLEQAVGDIPHHVSECFTRR